MIQLTSFQDITSNEFDESILQTIVVELYKNIKENRLLFRLLIEIESGTLEERLYKHAITLFLMARGFKVVKYPGLLYIDWSAPHIHPTSNPMFQLSSPILGDVFTAEDLYMSITNNVDLRNVSYRILLHKIQSEIKSMNTLGKDTSIINVGITTHLDDETLNNMFAPDLLKLSIKYDDVLLTFISGGMLKITLYDMPEIYTDIPYDILFGTRLDM